MNLKLITLKRLILGCISCCSILYGNPYFTTQWIHQISFTPECITKVYRCVYVWFNNFSSCAVLNIGTIGYINTESLESSWNINFTLRYEGRISWTVSQIDLITSESHWNSNLPWFIGSIDFHITHMWIINSLYRKESLLYLLFLY